MSPRRLVWWQWICSLKAMQLRSTHQRGSASVLLLIVCLVLGAALLYHLRTETKTTKDYLDTICQISNRWHDVSLKLNEQKLVNLSLERDLSEALEGAHGLSNKLRRDFVTTVTIPPAASVPVPRPDPRLPALEEEKDGLTSQVDNLTGALERLDCELAETQRKLNASEGDRNALLRELKRIEADRSRLMVQFNDIALVREQLRKLKAEQAVNRRLAWIRHDVYGSYKGAELLRKSLASAPASSSAYDLNVEVNRDGAARVVPVSQ